MNRPLYCSVGAIVVLLASMMVSCGLTDTSRIAKTGVAQPSVAPPPANASIQRAERVDPDKIPCQELTPPVMTADTAKTIPTTVASPGLSEDDENLKELENSLPLNSSRVPISLDKLIIKLGKSYDRVEKEMGHEYIWTFRNGLEIRAGSGCGDKEMFNAVTFSARSLKPIPNCPYCPFGFVINQTTFNQVNARFKNKLQKLYYPKNAFKVYADGAWNHFYFKNQKLTEISIALFEWDMVS